MINESIFNDYFYPLIDYVSFKDIAFSFGQGCAKYLISQNRFNIEISYYVLDKFYRIKVETKLGLYKIIFLTKSKKFKKDIKKFLRKKNLEWNNLNNHIVAFCFLLRELLYYSECFNNLNMIYKENLKFDGIFI